MNDSERFSVGTSKQINPQGGSHQIPVKNDKNFHLEFNTYGSYRDFMLFIIGKQEEKDKLYTKVLKTSTIKLMNALKKANLLLSGNISTTFPCGEIKMPSVVLDELAAQIASTSGAMESATIFVNGVANKIAEAVKKAVDNGATEAQLAPFNELGDALNEQAQKLSAAVAANSDDAVDTTDETVI